MFKVIDLLILLLINLVNEKQAILNYNPGEIYAHKHFQCTFNDAYF